MIATFSDTLAGDFNDTIQKSMQELLLRSDRRSPYTHPLEVADIIKYEGFGPPMPSSDVELHHIEYTLQTLSRRGFLVLISTV